MQIAYICTTVFERGDMHENINIAISHVLVACQLCFQLNGAADWRYNRRLADGLRACVISHIYFGNNWHTPHHSGIAAYHQIVAWVKRTCVFSRYVLQSSIVNII